MGVFRVDCSIENILNRHKSVEVRSAIVDTGSEYTWAPAPDLERIGIAREKKDITFLMANGQQVTRSVGFAIVRVGEKFTVDEVVFAEPGDLSLLGARSLEGLNLVVEPSRKRLTAAGPIPAARTRSTGTQTKKRKKD
jgi:predicted aspartyl protease